MKADTHISWQLNEYLLPDIGATALKCQKLIERRTVLEQSLEVLLKSGGTQTDGATITSAAA